MGLDSDDSEDASELLAENRDAAEVLRAKMSLLERKESRRSLGGESA